MDGVEIWLKVMEKKLDELSAKLDGFIARDEIKIDGINAIKTDMAVGVGTCKAHKDSMDKEITAIWAVITEIRNKPEKNKSNFQYWAFLLFGLTGWITAILKLTGIIK